MEKEIQKLLDSDENSPETIKEVPDDLLPAEPDVRVTNECCQVIEGEIVEMNQSAAFSVLSDEVTMSESAAMIIRTEQANIEGSAVFFLSANEVRGNVISIFTPLTAAILGGAILLGVLIFRPRR